MRPYLRRIRTEKKLIFENFKGLYTSFGDEGCPEGFSPFMKNISALSYPNIKVRKGRREICSLDGKILYFGVIEGKYLSCIEKKDGVCKWKYFDGEWKDICTVPESDTGRYSMLYFLNATILLTGKKEVVSGIEKSKSFALTFENGVPKAKEEKNMPYCDMADTIGGRLAVASSEGDKIFLGGIMDRKVWFDISDGYEGSMITQNCENITAIKVFGGHLVCFKGHSFGELYGNTPDTYTQIMVSDSMGCVAEKSIVDCGRLLWLSEEGIVSYGGGSLPKILSRNVQKYIDNFDKERKEECSAGYDGIRYIISLPQKGGGKINLVLNLESGMFFAEDERDFRFFANMGGVLYGADQSGRICILWDENSEEKVAWEWESPVLGADFFGKNNLHKIFVSGKFSGSVTIKIKNDKDCISESTLKISEREETHRDTFSIKLHPALFTGKETFQIIISGEGKGEIFGVGIETRDRR